MIFVIDNYLFSVKNFLISHCPASVLPGPEKKSQSGGNAHGRSKKTCSQESRQSSHQTR